MAKEKMKEVQNPRVIEYCDSLQHQFIPISVEKGPQLVHVLLLCQRCGLINSTAIGYPGAWTAESKP